MRDLSDGAIASKIEAAIRLAYCESEDLRPERRLREDLAGDSLEIVELMMALEDEFGIEIPDEDFEADKIKTIADVRAYVTRRVRA